MGKRDLSEEDIKARYITPAVEQSGWDKKQIRYEYAFTAGRIILRGNVTSRGKQKRADYRKCRMWLKERFEYGSNECRKYRGC